jgi:hypothetical protein
MAKSPPLAPAPALPGEARSADGERRRVRHNAATELRKESCPPKPRRRRFGLETARIILGHRSAAITEVYAEQNEREAIEAIIKVG